MFYTVTNQYRDQINASENSTKSLMH